MNYLFQSKNELMPNLIGKSSKIGNASQSQFSGTEILYPNPVKAIMLICFLLLAAIPSFGQNYPKTYQTWNDIGEDYENLIDVAYSVTKCDSSAKDSIFLLVFNEKPVADTSSFDVTIFSEDKQDSTIVSFTVELAISEMARHECGSGIRKDLVMVVPKGYDPEKLTVTIKFD